MTRAKQCFALIVPGEGPEPGIIGDVAISAQVRESRTTCRRPNRAGPAHDAGLKCKLHTVLAAKLVDPTRGIDDLLRTRIKRVARRTNIDVQFVS